MTQSCFGWRGCDSAAAQMQGRSTAFGLFTAVYGVSWFLGSAAIGFLYDVSLSATIVFCVVTEFAAVPIFLWVGRRYREEFKR
jgi:predicted MFS family arabinose efflux permease